LALTKLTTAVEAMQSTVLVEQPSSKVFEQTDRLRAAINSFLKDVATA